MPEAEKVGNLFGSTSSELVVLSGGGGPPSVSDSQNIAICAVKARGQHISPYLASFIDDAAKPEILQRGYSKRS
jgi:hypothetical protein